MAWWVHPCHKRVSMAGRCRGWKEDVYQLKLRSKPEAGEPSERLVLIAPFLDECSSLGVTAA